jgi:hypothetical protein
MRHCIMTTANKLGGVTVAYFNRLLHHLSKEANKNHDNLSRKPVPSQDLN